MEKIKMTTPLVEMDGDEMTRVLWKMIKDELILPFVELKTEYYDLGLLHRNETKDQVTVEAANATRRLRRGRQMRHHHAEQAAHGGVSAAHRNVEEPERHDPLHSGRHRVPHAHLHRHASHPVVKNWKKPITIARHAYGDVYKSVDLHTTEPG